MNTLKHPLTGWSFEAEDEVALGHYTEELFLFARECEEHPSEELARKVCGAARHVWDTAEGMTQTDLSIAAPLLERALQGIDLCIKSVLKMQSSTEMPERTEQHIGDMIAAMTERRDDLQLLLDQGKNAFLRQLRARRPKAT